MTTNIVQSISDEQLADLEDLCGKATQGNWWIDSHGVTMMAMDSLEVVFTTPCDPKTAVRHPETGNLSNWRNDWDASYIATACPSNVQGLIARLRAAEVDAKRLDFMIREGCVVESQNGNMSPMVYRLFWRHLGSGQREWYPTEREAIDAAMELFR